MKSPNAILDAHNHLVGWRDELPDGKTAEDLIADHERWDSEEASADPRVEVNFDVDLLKMTVDIEVTAHEDGAMVVSQIAVPLEAIDRWFAQRRREAAIEALREADWEDFL